MLTSAAERRGLIEARAICFVACSNQKRHPRQNAAASLKLLDPHLTTD